METERKTSHWDNLVITKNISHDYKGDKDEMHDEWVEEMRKIRRKGLVLSEETLDNHFLNVTNKSLDSDRGFGYISQHGPQHDVRVVMKGNSPFINNQQEMLSAPLWDHTPYSLVYNLKDNPRMDQKGRTFYIFRHYLHIPTLTEDERRSIKVAAVEGETVNQGRLHAEDKIKKEVFDDNKVIFKEEKYVNVQENHVKMERKVSQETTGTLEKNRLKKTSTKMALMEQMNSLIMPLGGLNRQGSMMSPGRIVVTVHKAVNLEKKGLAGKADPYAVISIDNQKFKSATVNNDQSPTWHFTGVYDINEKSLPELDLEIEVYDDDIGKDDFLGKCSMKLGDMWESDQEILNKWIDLEECKSGKLLVSAKLVPLELIGLELGQLYVTIHKARKIEKKSKFRTSDPYAILKLGTLEQRSKTVHKSKNPEWEYVSSFQICEDSPRQCSVQIFDEDIGKDSPLGNLVIDTKSIITEGEMKNVWLPLENCKSGEVLISAQFSASKPPAKEEKISVVDTFAMETKATIKNEISEYALETKEPMAIKTEIKEEMADNICFLDPLFLDDEYLVVEGSVFNWFLVVSSMPHLPIRSRLVPFKVLPDLVAQHKLYLYCLPGTGTQLIRKVLSQQKELAKCGYEKSCVLTNGSVYEICGETGERGRVVVKTWGRQEERVDIQPKSVEAKDFFEATMNKAGCEDEVVVSGPISLYDRLTVDLKLGSYKLGS